MFSIGIENTHRDSKDISNSGCSETQAKTAKKLGRKKKATSETTTATQA
jgi:hypothetical protein